MSDRVVANLLYRGKENNLAILARVGQPIPVDDGLFKLGIDIQIPMESLTLMPQGESDFVGGFDVYVVVANKDNDMSDVARKQHQIRVEKSDMGWYVVDAQQTNEFGQQLIHGPLPTLEAVREAIPGARDITPLLRQPRKPGGQGSLLC